MAENIFRKRALSYLKTIDEVIEKGPYKDNWASLAGHPVPDWYRDAKLGIFIHWGIYSVPAFGSEWYPRFMYQKDSWVYKHHLEKYGTPDRFGYKDFIPLFKAEKFSAVEWAELFEKAGARFVTPVAEHHDGFPMYDCQFTDWNATKMGPQRDIVGELKAEVEKRGMTFTASSHRIEHYWFMGGHTKLEASDIQNPEYGHLYWPSAQDLSDMRSLTAATPSEEFMEDWLVRTCELIDKYRPKIVYFDWWIEIQSLKPYLKKLAAYYYNRAAEWNEQVTINYKNDAMIHTSAVRDIERGQLSDVSPYFWQNDTSVAKNSWCYTEGNDYKQPVDVICDLIDVCSKNGSLLLNIGPKADGTIPEKDQEILLAMGDFLQTNGEAIYGSYPFRKFGEGPTQITEGHFTDTARNPFTAEDFRFTCKPGVVYCFALKESSDGVYRVKALRDENNGLHAPIKEIYMLGSDEKVSFVHSKDFLTIITPPTQFKRPVCFKVIVD